MAGSSDAEILIKIQENHLPFIKKLLSYFEKKKEKSQKHDELRSLYNTFTTASVNEQVSVYNANRKKLDKWYKMYEQVSKTKKREAEDESQENSARSSKQQKVEQRPIMSNAPGSGIAIVSYGSVSSTSNNNATSQPVSSMVNSSSNTGNSEQEVTSESVTFVCASCQFNTLNETEFSQHAKNDHKNELSLWCRQCWRCFSNIGALVAHIKEKSCQKEEMIYKCGVKDCTFEVSSGQTFVHHLRHCHKGSPFIFCVHCQKIFTLPHCLVLHMQNECPYKDRNRKTPGSAPSNDTPNPVPSIPVQPPIMGRTLAPARGSTAVAPAQSTRGVQRQSQSALTTIVKDHSGRGGYGSRGRGRGKGRGRGVVRYSDSSDSEDADDPSWMPDPNASTLPVRRSARWAKKVSDARNPDLFDATAENPRKKSISSAEIREKNLLSCPCCDFMAAIRSVLEDHFIGIHKAPDKNACLVCNVKFENVKFFLDHFENHPEVEPKPPEPIAAEVPKRAPITKNVQSSSNSIVSGSSLPPVASNIPKALPSIITRVPTLGSTVITTPTGAYLAKNHEVLAGIDGDGLECIVENVVSGNENVDVTRGEPLTTIPYQAAIHKKNQKDAKLKKFEDLKSPRDLLTLKEDPNLQHFFKCVMYNCTFTTDEGDSFAYHIDNDHKGRRLHCGYCLTEYFSGAHLKEHMLKDHGKRRWQCSNCFYRACSKAHVQIHIKNMHPSEDARIRTCAMQPIVEDDQGPGDVTKTWPFICAVGDCKFQTFVPQEFKRHNETVHRSVSVFICYYCKVDFISFKRLMDHYRLHGINTYQCTYCVHGSDTKDEILLHLCNVHADKPFKIHFRTAEENIPGGTIQSIRVAGGDNSSNENSNASVEKSNVAPAAEPVAQNSKKISSKSNDISNNFELKAIKQEKEDDSIEDKFFDQVEGKCYPKKVQRISSDFFCGIPFCDELFDDLSLYISHLRNLHFALNFPCPHCPTFSKDLVSFKSHLLSHGPNLYACSNTACNFYDWDLKNVDNHAKEHSEESSSIVVREDISDNLENGASSNEVTKIRNISFDDISKINDLCFECPFCEFKSFHQGTMKNHIYKEISYKRFICNFCQEEFCSRKDTVNHFTEFHSSEDLNSTINVMRNAEIEYVVRKILMNEKVLNPASSYNCENCSKVFKSVIEEQHHLRLCLFNNYCPYDCNYCRRSFNDLRLLKFHFDSRHMTNNISFTIIISHNAEQKINQKIQQLRLKHLKNTLENEQFSSKKLESFSYKYYKCEDCNYKAEFKFDVEKHIKTDHIGKYLKVEKVVENLKKSHVLNIVPKEDNKSTLEESTVSLRYQCSHCPKKAFYLQEIENHMDSHGIQDELYYYWPDTHQDFSPTDTDTYECGFCSVKGNLHSLKNHGDMLHSIMPLKVKGLVLRPKETNRNIMCSQCYQRMTYNELKKHTNTVHPSLSAKSFNDLENLSLKRKLLAEPLPPPKKVKFETSALSCAHCGGIFSTQQQISEHSRRHHARLPLKYEDLLTDVTDATDHFFFKCDFCPFVSESNFTEKHMSAKHKMLVSCAYCGKRFDSATKLKEHHDDIHKGMRWTIESSKTYNNAQGPSQNLRVMPSDSIFEESPPDQSHYGKKPEKIDYESMTFAIDIQQPNVPDLIAPLAYLYNTFNMFPVVLVKDCEKDGK